MELWVNGWNSGKFLFKSKRLMELNGRCRIRLREARDGFMGKVEQYRHYAAECLRLAQQTSVAAEKDTLLGMAEAWRRLAERAETNGKSEGEPE
jgi:hypothetical protein